MRKLLLAVLCFAPLALPLQSEAALIQVTATDPLLGTELSFLFDTTAPENTDGDFTYEVGYRADFTSFANASGKMDYVGGIDLRLNDGTASLTGFSVVDEPIETATGGWTYVIDKGLNGNDPCSGNGSPDGVLCGEQTLFAYAYPDLTNGLPTSGIYDWTFTLTYDQALSFPDVLYNARIRAVFGFVDDCSTGSPAPAGGSKKLLTPSNGGTTEPCFNYQGLSSLTTPSDGQGDGSIDGYADGATSAPEPGSLLLLGAALIGIAARLRRN